MQAGNRRVLITGGAGFIGSHLLETAAARGWELGVLDDLSSGRREHVAPGLPFFEADVRDRAAVENAFRDFAPGSVVHLAAQTSVAASSRNPEFDAEVNIFGGLNVLSTAQAHGVSRFVFMSTGGAMYGHVPPGAKAAADWMPRPASPYGISKLAFERYLGLARKPGRFETTILRPSNVYGARQDPHGEAGVVAIFRDRLLERRPLVVYGREIEGDEGCIRDYVHVSDVVRAALTALEGGLRHPVVHVSTGIGTSTRALLGHLERLLGTTADVRPRPPRPGDVRDSVLQPDVQLPSPMPLLEGLRATIEPVAAGRSAASASAADPQHA